ncbi:MAG: hypothetical protein PQJ50_06250 [Spirochaetales bacterium]|nr:hypothetical protein [Spirochaetales bacterium]
MAAALLYNLGFLSPLFAVPLQLSAGERSRRNFLASSLVSVSLILAFRAMVLKPLGALGFIYLDGCILLLAALGLYICNFELQNFHLPVRLAAATASAAVIVFLMQPVFGTLRDQIVPALDQTLAVFGGGMDGELMLLFIQDLFGRTGFAWYFFFIAFSHWLGKNITKRFGVENQSGNEHWEMPDGGIWFLFVPLTVFLLNKLTMRSGLQLLSGIPAYAVSNALLIGAGSYALRGLVMIRALMKKKGLSVQMQRLLLMTTGFLAVMPGLNLVVLILFAGIGVSELWVNYRIFDKE